MFPHRLFLEGDVTSCSAVCYAPAHSSQTFEYLDTILRSAHRKTIKFQILALVLYLFMIELFCVFCFYQGAVCYCARGAGIITEGKF